METSENIEAPEPMRWRDVKAGTQALLKCVGCKTHFWAAESEVGTRCFCTERCGTRFKERQERAKERAEHKKKLMEARKRREAGRSAAS